MIGPRVGMRAGLRSGPAVGMAADPISNATGGAPATTTLTVSIADSADPVITEVDFNYTITVTNTGGIDATAVEAVLTLDPQLTYVSGSGTGWSVSHLAGVVTCTRAANLAPGAAPALTITVTSGAAAETSSSTVVADASNAVASVNDTETTVVELVTKDATSGKRYPASSAEWTSLINYAGLSGSVSVPNSLYLCQEASGNLADSIGSLTLTANATPLYQQAVADHTRLGVGFTQVANQRFAVGAGSGPNPNTTSQTWLWFQRVTATPAANRTLSQISNGATSLSILLTTTTRIRISIAGVTTDGTANPTSVGTQPICTKYNRTGSEIKTFTSQEKITGTYSAAVVDGIKGVGAGTSYPGECVYGCMWSSAAAEMSDATIKSLLEALGWAIPWS